jgi:plasmid stabilization system protein ParE
LTASIAFHPAADEELTAAVEWYRERSERASERFAAELFAAVEQIRCSPSIFAPFTAGTRRVPLRRFPYYLVFREGPHRIEILAVAHAKRRPGYWRTRARD